MPDFLLVLPFLLLSDIYPHHSLQSAFCFITEVQILLFHKASDCDIVLCTSARTTDGVPTTSPNASNPASVFVPNLFATFTFLSFKNLAPSIYICIHTSVWYKQDSSFLFWYRFVYTDFYYTPFILKIPPLLLSYFYQLLKYFAQSFHCWTFCSSNNKIRLGKLKSFSQTDFQFVLFSFVVPYISRGYFAVSSATIPLTFSMLSSL